ncbi:MAG: CHAD domain-containing protein [Pseudomonadota bacterium]
MKYPTKELLLKALDSRWHHYRQLAKACRSNPGEAEVHDLRTSIRRLLALMALVKGIAGGKSRARDRLRKYLKRQLDEFDELRDLTVADERVGRYLTDFPALTPFADWLGQEVTRAHRDLRHRKYRKLPASQKRRYRKIRKQLARCSEDLAPPILASLGAALEKCREKLAAASASAPGTIHEARIALKQLRYLVEVAGPVDGLPEPNSLAHLQTLTGEVQDLQVFTLLLAKFSQQHDLPDVDRFSASLQVEQTAAAREAIAEGQALLANARILA